ncbi:hypothetical protein O6H91_Y362800 [Diphasiastrum complanatum]|nr:hypothetical protein O6H91_Y362800 [Diphasiastrum complanatum]
MDLRPVMCFHQYPTLLFFASGKGIAIARSIIEARDGDFGSLNFDLRQEIRLYYSAPTPSLLMYKERFNQWEKKKMKVRLTVDAIAGQTWDGHVGTLSQLWDADDLEYDPETTAVVVCAEKNEEDIDKLLDDAGIPEEQIEKWDSNPSPALL